MHFYVEDRLWKCGNWFRKVWVRDTGRTVSFEDIWRKLESLYNLDALEGLESEGYDSPSSSNSVYSVRSPSPSENLSAHPFFHEEFALPGHDDAFENLLASRRLRATASAASTPLYSASPNPGEKGSITVPTSAATTTSISAGGGNRRAKDKGKMAGLVGGDSDSSALTQDSGDEGVTPFTSRESVATGTDAGTDAAEDEDVEMEESPDPAPAPKPARNQKPTSKKGSGATGRTRSTAASSARLSKKRKR